MGTHTKFQDYAIPNNDGSRWRKLVSYVRTISNLKVGKQRKKTTIGPNIAWWLQWRLRMKREAAASKI
jgi:hypothetical protein